MFFPKLNSDSDQNSNIELKSHIETEWKINTAAMIIAENPFSIINVEWMWAVQPVKLLQMISISLSYYKIAAKIDFPIDFWPIDLLTYAIFT